MSEATAPAAPAPAPSAPAAPFTPTQSAPSSSEPSTDAKPAPAKAEHTAKPPGDVKVQRKEVRANAAKELLAELTKRREGDAKPEDKPTGEQKQAKEAPKPKPDEKGTPEPKEGKEPPQRGQDGKFAPKPGDAKPDAAKPVESAPAQPPKPDNGESEQRLSRTLRELNNKTAEVETERRTSKELKAKLDQFEAREAQRKKENNPLDILADYGWDLDKVAREVVEKGLRPRSMRPQLPDEVRAEIDSLKEFKERYEKQETDAKQRQFRDNSLRALGDYLKGNAEKYPFTAAIKWAGGTIVDATINAKRSDMTEDLIAFEKSMAETSLGLWGNEAVFKAALTSKPELREKWLAWLGATPSKEADPPASKQERDNGSTDGPSSLSSVPTGQAPKPKTRRESKRAAVGAFDSEWRAARNR